MGQDSVLREAMSTILKQRIAYSGSLPEYIGEAYPGYATDEARWRIKKLTYDGSSVTQIDWANSSTAMSFKWDSRTSYAYG